MKKFLILGIVYLILGCNMNKNDKEPPTSSSSLATASSSTLTPIPPGVRKEGVNDPVVHLKYWYWGGHSPRDLAEYIWIKYRNTKWKVTPQEAQVLKSQAMKILDEAYKKKVEKRFKKCS